MRSEGRTRKRNAPKPARLRSRMPKDRGHSQRQRAYRAALEALSEPEADDVDNALLAVVRRRLARIVEAMKAEAKANAEAGRDKRLMSASTARDVAWSNRLIQDVADELVVRGYGEEPSKRRAENRLLAGVRKPRRRPSTRAVSPPA